MTTPIAWHHTMTYETGETVHRLTFDDGTDPDEPRRTAFGIPGRDYSEEYAVTSEPLFTRASPDQDVERIVAWLRELPHGYPEAHPIRSRIADQIERGDYRNAD